MDVHGEKEQRGTQERSQEAVGLQTLSGREADEHRQEVKRSLVQVVEHLVGTTIGRYACKGGQEREHGSGQAAGHEHRNHRAEGTSDERENGVRHTALRSLGVFLGGGRIVYLARGVDALDLLELLVQLGHVLTDYELVLAVLHYEVQHAGNLLGRNLIDLAGIHQVHAQARHAMGDVSNVRRTTTHLNDCSRNTGVVLLSSHG